MKHSSVPVVALAVGALALAGDARVAASSASQTGTGSPGAVSVSDRQLTIDGTATMVGKWTCAGEATVRLEPDRAATPVPGLLRGVQEVVVTTPVSAIECNNKRMNEHLRAALKARDYPDIRYRATRYTLVDGGTALQASGEITIAGVTRAIEFGVKLTPLSEGSLRVVGNVEIDMLEFGVTPPSLLLGTLRVRNVVVVKFNTVLRMPSEVA
jgi:polyisoprenoid-binding protein YceI